MSRNIKKWLVTATMLIVLGLIIFFCVMVAYDFDFYKLSTVSYTTNSYDVRDDFDKISIDVDTTEIELVPSDDEQCRIVCFESEKTKHSAIVEDGILSISIIDNRKWYDHIGISFRTPKMTVYLPQEEYTSLIINTDTGNIAIPEDFAFKDIQIKGDTSDVDCSASVSNIIEIKLSTGDINMDNITVGQFDLTTATGDINVNSVIIESDIDIKTDTGEVKLANISCTDFTAKSDTGTISLKNVVASGDFSVENDTGDVKFENSDATQISVKTSTGDVSGTLLSEKVFITETSTGNVSVPKSVTGGKCEIITDTGDIKIDIK